MSSGELTLCSVCKTYMWPHCICLCPNVNPEKNENNHLANEEYKKRVDFECQSTINSHVKAYEILQDEYKSIVRLYDLSLQRLSRLQMLPITYKRSYDEMCDAFTSQRKYYDDKCSILYEEIDRLRANK